MDNIEPELLTMVGWVLEEYNVAVELDDEDPSEVFLPKPRDNKKMIKARYAAHMLLAKELNPNLK